MRHGRSTVTLDLVGTEKGELSQRDYTNLPSTGWVPATLTASRTAIISRYLVRWTYSKPYVVE